MSRDRAYFFFCFSRIIDPAEIIQTRYNEGEGHYEYYVHYEGYNRRLDEWVPRDRIMSSRFDMSDQSWKNSDRNPASDLLADSSDRKITRNQKRRHDEINHIQKVSTTRRIHRTHNIDELNRYRRTQKWIRPPQHWKKNTRLSPKLNTSIGYK